MLTAPETLAALLAELGGPALHDVDPPLGPKRLRAALRQARRTGGVVAGVARSSGEAGLARSWLARDGAREVRTIQVEEGWLLVARASRARPRARSRRRELPLWTSPDARPVPGAMGEDLDEDTVRRWLEGHDASEWRPAPRVGPGDDWSLGGVGILALDDGAWRPTVAAMVLAGRRPELFLPACAVVGEVDGGPFEVVGTVPEMLRTLGRGPLRPFDGRVLRESVLNALLHRDWTVDAPVEIRAVGERVEVANPGEVSRPGPPNPLLMRLAVVLGLTAGHREGLGAISARLARQGRRDFSLVARDGVVRFVAEVRRRQPREAPPVPLISPAPPPVPAAPELPCPEPAPPAPVEVPPAPPAPAPVPSLLPRDPDDRADAVLRVLRHRGRATTREIAEALGCSRPVIGKVLTVLVAEGRVRTTVEPERSPFQAYEAVDGIPGEPGT